MNKIVINTKDIRKQIDQFVINNHFDRAIRYLEKYKMVIAFKKDNVFSVLFDSKTWLSIETPEDLEYCIGTFEINNLILEEVFTLNYKKEKLFVSVCEIDKIIQHHFKM